MGKETTFLALFPTAAEDEWLWLPPWVRICGIECQAKGEGFERAHCPEGETEAQGHIGRLSSGWSWTPFPFPGVVTEAGSVNGGRLLFSRQFVYHEISHVKAT